jgi:hypothetical protein
MPFTDLIAHGQACAQIWERILYSLGSCTVKSFWYLIYWQWVNGQPELYPNISCPGIIALTSGNVPNYTMIPQLEVWEAWWPLLYDPHQMGTTERQVSSCSTRPTSMQLGWQHLTWMRWIPSSSIKAHTFCQWHTPFWWQRLIQEFWTRFNAEQCRRYLTSLE